MNEQKKKTRAENQTHNDTLNGMRCAISYSCFMLNGFSFIFFFVFIYFREWWMHLNLNVTGRIY